MKGKRIAYSAYLLTDQLAMPEEMMKGRNRYYVPGIPKALRSIVVLVWLCVCLVGTGVQGVGAEYVYRCLAFLGYGSGEHQIGLLDVPAIPRTGPESFWVDGRGDVYICDTVNSRVIHLSSDGYLVDLLNLEYACNDIAVDDDGNMFILEWRSGIIHYVSRGGFEAQTCRLSQQLLAEFDRLSITHNKPVLISGEQVEYELAAFDEVVPITLGQDHVQERKGLSGKNNVRVETRTTPLGRAEVTIIEEDRSSQGASFARRSDVSLPPWDVVSVEFIGQDVAGNLYIQVECWDSLAKGITLNVYSIGLNAQVEEVMRDMPNDYWLWTVKLLQANKRGDIYQLLPTPNGVYVNAWTRSQGD